MSDSPETTAAVDPPADKPRAALAPLSPEMRTMYFETLRAEILQVKARLARLIVIGLVGTPVLTYFAMTDTSAIRWALLLSPIMVMLLIVLYFSEQMSMMRAGSFIYDQVEADGSGWEHWVDEMRARAAEPPLFGLLVVVSVAYSLVMASFAVEDLWYINPADYSYFVYFLLAYVVPGIYALTFIWVFATLFSFWRSAFRAKIG
ncbi:MAG: hypothetical protein AAF333_03160 [Planctomycetota bacterium]